MKAWRLDAAKVNERRAAGSKEGTARQQMQQMRSFNKAHPAVGSGSWLMDTLLIRGGFPAAVWGDPLSHKDESPTISSHKCGAPPVSRSILSSFMRMMRRWWTK